AAQHEAANVLASFGVREFTGSGRPHFEGRSGTSGQPIKGAANDAGTVGICSFRDAKLPAGRDAAFEARFGIERSGVDTVEETDEVTQLAVRVKTLSNGTMSDEVIVKPESN